MTLIEKDFLSFGHQFKIRNGYYSKEEQNENQNSPILLQYLDATHQLLVQYPMYFEFNMKFLLFIANNINSGLYGTFLYNSEKEREQKNAKNNTMSCWTEILNNINQYKNPFYEVKTKKIYFFTPIFPFSRIRLWEEFFLPFTQINVNLSYDSYINRFTDNFYYNIFGQIKQKTRIISNVMFIDREKDSYIKNLEKLKKENQKLKMALKDFTINNNINKELYDKLNKDTITVVNNLAKEEGGEFNLNEELNEYIYKQVKPVEKPQDKEEEKIEDNKFEENMRFEENIKIDKNVKIDDIIKSEENKNEKKPKIDQETIDMFFGRAKTVNEKTINKKYSNEKLETKNNKEKTGDKIKNDKNEIEKTKKLEENESKEEKEENKEKENEENNNQQKEGINEENNINNEEKNEEENNTEGNDYKHEEEINNENKEQEVNNENVDIKEIRDNKEQNEENNIKNKEEEDNREYNEEEGNVQKEKEEKKEEKEEEKVELKEEQKKE